ALVRLDVGLRLIGNAADAGRVAGGRAWESSLALAVEQVLRASALVVQGAVGDVPQQRGVTLPPLNSALQAGGREAILNQLPQSPVSRVGMLPWTGIVGRHGRHERL